jgi:hypothetical protein
MYLLLLAYLERTLEWVHTKWEIAKQKLRTWLGPAPQDFLLLADGGVLPATVHLPDAERATAHLYDAATSRICRFTDPSPTGRFRPMPILSLTIEKEGAVYDLTDWVSEIRANPVTPFSPKQLAQLWILTTNQWAPLTGGCQVTITNGTGETEVATWA